MKIKKNDLELILDTLSNYSGYLCEEDDEFSKQQHSTVNLLYDKIDRILKND